MNDNRRNVFWFLIDGLSPDYLHACGNTEAERCFFDELLEKSALFTNVSSTAAGTHTSMHSVFSSMYPSINGAAGWSIEALRKFDPTIFTITDFFKTEGYSTFRYGDAAKERDVPKTGFDIWESSGVSITNLLVETDFTDNQRRRAFIERVNKCFLPKFVYHHCLILHELNGKLGSVWKNEDYLKNIQKSAVIFKKLFTEYEINEDDIVILSSDHGVILDFSWENDGIQNGERHYEQSVKTFFSLYSNDIERGVYNCLISSIDEAPTIVELALGIKMPGQGLSRLPLLRGDEYQDTIVYREKGTYCNKPLSNSLTSDLFYVRQGNWKYTYGVEDEKCEWLINLDEGDYKINHLEDKPRRDYFKQLIFNTFFNSGTNVALLYAQNGFSLLKAELPVRITVIIDEKLLNHEVYGSITDLAGPYHHIIVLNSTKTYSRFNVTSYPQSMDNLSIDAIRGDIVVVLERRCVYSEYLLSDLFVIFEENKTTDHVVLFETGFAVLKKNFRCRKGMSTQRVNIRDVDCVPQDTLIARIKKEAKKVIKRNKITVDFYLIDAFEIFHFLPLYEALNNCGIDAMFIAEPCEKNTAKTWFDYDNAVRILTQKSLKYLKKARKKADVAFTTQDAYLLRKYSDKTIRINLSYGFSFKKDYFIHSKRTTDGFDYRFVHGDRQKEILSAYIEKNRILKVGYPKYKNCFDSLPKRADIQKELNICTEKPILVYFPTWDDDNSIMAYAKEIQKLREEYFVVIKAHHCITPSKKPEEYRKIFEISDLVLEGNYDFAKAVLIADVAIADAKSGASFEIGYINNEVPIALILKTPVEKEKYEDEMWRCFNVISKPEELQTVVRKTRIDNSVKDRRNEIIEDCLGIKNYNYMPIIIEFIRNAVLRNKK